MEHRAFIAFYAQHRIGTDEGPGAMFTQRAMDGSALAAASRVRIFHGFGPTEIVSRNAVHEVIWEGVIRYRRR